MIFSYPDPEQTGIVAGDLQAQITDSGDFRDRFTDKRDHLSNKVDHLYEKEERKRREDYESMHKDRSRSPIRIYFDQFYEVSSVGV